MIGVSNRVGGLSKPGPAGLFLNIEKVFMRDNKQKNTPLFNMQKGV